MRRDELLRGRAAQFLFTPATPSTSVPSGSTLETSIGLPCILVAPPADGVEVLHREADRIHAGVATGAGRIRAMLHHRFAHRERLPGSLPSVLSAGTFGGGGGGGEASRFSSTYLPRSTGDVRVE